MKHLSLSEGQHRLVLVVPDRTPLRAAAKSVRGYRFEGRNDGHAVFTFPAAPDVAALLIDSFEPLVSPSSRAGIAALQEQDRQLATAEEAKAHCSELHFDAFLRTQPMGHQIAALNFAWARHRAGAKGTGLLMEQGTGKSLVAIGLANGMAYEGDIDWVLAVVPNSLRGTWGGPDGEIAKHGASNFIQAILPTGTREARIRQAERAVAQGGFLWIVLNYEFFALNVRKNPEHREYLEDLVHLARRRPGMIVFDESSMLKNYRAKRTRVLCQLAAEFHRSLILTGTPVTSSPLDVYSQFEAMDKGSLGFGSYAAFDRTYAMRSRRKLRSGAHFEEVVGFQNLDDLEGRVAKLSYRARAADCLDLPEVITKRIPVDLSTEQSRMIAALKTDMMAELESGELVDGRNILTRYLRMGQAIGGFVGVLGDDGKPKEKPRALFPNPKLDALREYLELLFDDPEQKAVVFAQYRAEIEAIVAMARKKDWKPVPFYGGVSEEKREEGLRRFRKDPHTRLFVAQYQAGSKGLTLVEAATVIFYSLTFSLEDFLQARKRVHRIGQTKTVTEAFLLGQVIGKRGPRRSLDHLILEALQRKQNFADVVTGDARKALEAL